jgi:hypothetical protein
MSVVPRMRTYYEEYGTTGDEASSNGDRSDVGDQTTTGESVRSPRSLSSQAGGWPEMGSAAFRGVAGEVVAMLDPHTEADPVALLLDYLTSFGSAVGAGPHAVADAAEHPARLNVVLVGETSRARKGTARHNIRTIMANADRDWSETQVMGGLASGEGLIAAVADEDGDEPKATDKRLLVVEPEFARLLRVAGREGSTLSPIVRDAWDSGDLRVMTRTNPLCAPDAHVSVLGHITVDELRARMRDTEAANGFANRFLFALVRRSKLLPSGGKLTDDERSYLSSITRAALDAARKVGLVRRTGDAEARWAELYEALAENDPGGLIGALTARAEAQMLRLSVVYALLDGSSRVTVEHLDAAEAVWSYCAASAAYIFGDTIGDEIADRLLDALRAAGPDGLTGTDQRDLFARHVSGARIEQARQLLEDRGLARTTRRDTGGRPAVITTATEAPEAPKGTHSSPRSLPSQPRTDHDGGPP